MTSVSELVGIPFATGGRDYRPTVGAADCLGIVTEALRRLGIPWQDPWERVAEQWERGERPIGAAIPDGWRELPAATPLQFGDVVLSMSKGTASHVSLALGRGNLLHTTESTGSLIVRDRILRGKVVAVFRRQEVTP